MQRLICYIEKLLIDHNFVIIPGFGGFIAGNAASIDINGTIYPPHKDIRFNPDLYFNDGLLVQQYAIEGNITFEEASREVDSCIIELKRQLQEWRHIKFGTLGMFHTTDSGVVFEAFEGSLALDSSYGLVPVFFPKLESCNATKNSNIHIATDTEGGMESVNIDSNKHHTLVYKVAAVAAILVAFVISTFHSADYKTDKGQTLTCQASLVPISDTVTAIDAGTDGVEIIEVENQASYNVIIGSFYSKRKAMQFLHEIPADISYECRIILSEHRYRVSYKSFDNEDECDAFLTAFTAENTRFSDAWILEIIENQRLND